MYYCELDDVKRLLRSAYKKVIIADSMVNGVEPHLSTAEARKYIWDESRKLDGEIGRYWKVPLVKVRVNDYEIYPMPVENIVQYRTAYEIYVCIFTANSPNEMPASIRYWKEEADRLVGMIIDGSIILEGQKRTVSSLPRKSIIGELFKYKGIENVDEGKFEYYKERLQ